MDVLATDSDVEDNPPPMIFLVLNRSAILVDACTRGC
jgi:hypothetical protein